MKAEMFKKLQDFIDDIKGQDKDVPSIEGVNDRDFFCEDDGCPSQPINKEEKPSLFDELGGLPAPESDNWDDEDTQDEHANKRRSSRSDFFHFWGCPWRRHDDETDEEY